jgi:large subunit ribosomal protein L10e
MALRKAGAYSKKHAVPFTRASKVKSKSYIKTVPVSKVTKYRMGDLVGFKEGKYKIVLEVKSKDQVQMRDNAIESMRQFMNRFLLEGIGKDFYFEVRPYPHHLLRENKMLTGAGADRMQTGMALSFGKTMGRAAMVKKGSTIFLVGVKDEKQEAIARRLIHSVKSRLPCSVSIDTIRAK